MNVSSTRVTFAFLAAIWTFPSSAAVFTDYDSLIDFTTALGGAATQTQDFSGFAVGTDLLGVPIVPGVTTTTANANLEAFDATNREMFSTASGGGRANPAYTFVIGGAYNAFGFDITAWNPDAPGSLVLTVLFADNDSEIFNLIRPPGALESEPQFFGIISDVAITSIALAEPPEVPPSDGLEEVAIDNVIAANVSEIPEPRSLGMVALGLIAAAALVRPRTGRATTGPPPGELP